VQLRCNTGYTWQSSNWIVAIVLECWIKPDICQRNRRPYLIHIISKQHSGNKQTGQQWAALQLLLCASAVHASKLLCCLAALHDCNAFNLLCQCIALQVLSCSHCVITVYALSQSFCLQCTVLTRATYAAAAAAVAIVVSIEPQSPTLWEPFASLQQLCVSRIMFVHATAKMLTSCCMLLSAAHHSSSATRTSSKRGTSKVWATCYSKNTLTSKANHLGRGEIEKKRVASCQDRTGGLPIMRRTR
jgi:hypothetical protein